MRGFVEFLAGLNEVLPLWLWFLIAFFVAGLAGLLWYFFPAWVPRRLPRLRKPRWRRPRFRWPRFTFRWQFQWRPWRWRWRRKKKSTPIEPAEVSTTDEELPDLPVETFIDLADRLAEEGRYAEAVRERLRAAVRALIDHGVITNRPGWTVTELARAAGSARPAVEAPLSSASEIFSDIWYGQIPATADHDRAMRIHVKGVTDAVNDRVAI